MADCFPPAKIHRVCVSICLRIHMCPHVSVCVCVPTSVCALGPMTGAMASIPGGPPMRKKHFL